MNRFPSEITTPTTPELLDDLSAAAVLEVKPSTLAVWRCTGRYNLPYIKVGRKVRYRRADLDAWLVSRTHTNSAEV